MPDLPYAPAAQEAVPVDGGPFDAVCTGFDKGCRCRPCVQREREAGR